MKLSKTQTEIILTISECGGRAHISALRYRGYGIRSLRALKDNGILLGVMYETEWKLTDKGNKVVAELIKEVAD